ncbi:MAG: DUF5947 family protein [Actinomycetota bacterium]|nr:DUF5947 family protein [Actinomycetota bacterium]
MTDPLAVLQRIRAERPAPVAPPEGEVCDLCGEPISDEHGHLVDVVARNLKCACRGCYLLFSSSGAGGGHFRSVPDRYLAFPDFDLTPARWDALQIPVAVAFFFLNSEMGRVAAFYPGPAGATESLLSLDTWNEIVAAQPTLATLQPDVEAFLVRVASGPGSVGASSRGPSAVSLKSPTASAALPVDRPAASPIETRAEERLAAEQRAPTRTPECYLVPIDACYDLVGRLRKLWRGFDGGSEARAALDEFFKEVAAKARPARPDDAPSEVPDLEWGDRVG